MTVVEGYNIFENISIVGFVGVEACLIALYLLVMLSKSGDRNDELIMRMSSDACTFVNLSNLAIAISREFVSQGLGYIPKVQDDLRIVIPSLRDKNEYLTPEISFNEDEEIQLDLDDRYVVIPFDPEIPEEGAKKVVEDIISHCKTEIDADKP